MHTVLLVFLYILVVELVAVTVTLLYFLCVVDSLCATVLAKYALIGSESHGATHVRDILLILHDVDDIVWSVLVHFARVGILIAEHVTGKLDYHHLHTQADTECRNVMLTSILSCDYLALYASVAESRADEDAILTCEFLSYVLLCDKFGVDVCDNRLAVVIHTCMEQRLAY